MTKRVEVGNYVYHPTRENELGLGAFAKVYKGTSSDGRQKVAIKKIKLRDVYGEEKQRVLEEGNMLRQLHNPWIVTLFDIVETKDAIYIVTEQCSCDLNKFLKEAGGKLNLPTMKRLIVDMANGYNFLFKASVFHRDIKPGNVLIVMSVTPIFKLTDFGLAKLVDSETAQLHSIAGTPIYMAPELHLKQPYSAKADMFSLGAVLFECWTGRRVITNHQDIHRVIMALEYSNPALFPVSIPPTPVALSDLVRRMLCLIQRDRMNPEEFFHHPAVVGNDPWADSIPETIPLDALPVPLVLPVTGSGRPEILSRSITASSSWLPPPCSDKASIPSSEMPLTLPLTLPPSKAVVSGAPNLPSSEAEPADTTENGKFTGMASPPSLSKIQEIIQKPPSVNPETAVPVNSSSLKPKTVTEEVQELVLRNEIISFPNSWSPSLKRLELIDCHILTQKTFSNHDGQQRLEYLMMWRCSVDEITLQKIGNLLTNELVELAIGLLQKVSQQCVQLKFLSTLFTGAKMVEPQHKPGLWGRSFPSKIFQETSALRSLQKLTVEYLRLTPDRKIFLASLSHLHQLKNLLISTKNEPFNSDELDVLAASLKQQQIDESLQFLEIRNWGSSQLPLESISLINALSTLSHLKQLRLFKVTSLLSPMNKLKSKGTKVFIDGKEL